MSPVHLSDEEFEAAVRDALDAIPREPAGCRAPAQYGTNTRRNRSVC